jgi:hypothetical protein
VLSLGGSGGFVLRGKYLIDLGICLLRIFLHALVGDLGGRVKAASSSLSSCCHRCGLYLADVDRRALSSGHHGHELRHLLLNLLLLGLVASKCGVSLAHQDRNGLHAHLSLVSHSLTLCELLELCRRDHVWIRARSCVSHWDSRYVLSVHILRLRPWHESKLHFHLRKQSALHYAV